MHLSSTSNVNPCKGFLHLSMAPLFLWFYSAKALTGVQINVTASAWRPVNCKINKKIIINKHRTVSWTAQIHYSTAALQGADPDGQGYRSCLEYTIKTSIYILIFVCVCVFEDITPGSVEEAEEAEPDDEFKDAIEVNTTPKSVICLFEVHWQLTMPQVDVNQEIL